MDIVGDVAALDAHDASVPVCVLIRPNDAQLLKRASELLIQGPASWPPGRRPRVVIEDGRVSIVAFWMTKQERPHEIFLVAAEPGLLVVAGDAALDLLRPTLSSSRQDVREALAACLVALANSSLEILDDLSAEAEDRESNVTGYLSGRERHSITRMRAHLFMLQQVFTANVRLLSPDGQLAEEMNGTSGKAMRHARAANEECESTAARLYALLGDVLYQQSAAITERLTLVSTIFLPLTLATGFFGMNFGWMTDRIGTSTTFLILGVASPLLLAAGTMVGVRLLSRRG